MLSKNLTLKSIYDISAIRIIVPTVDDCYTTLSVVHSIWEHVPEEFDDYIVTPKPNGYRSIHIAVIGSDGKNYEIQIRTQRNGLRLGLRVIRRPQLHRRRVTANEKQQKRPKHDDRSVRRNLHFIMVPRPKRWRFCCLRLHLLADVSSQKTPVTFGG